MKYLVLLFVVLVVLWALRRGGRAQEPGPSSRPEAGARKPPPLEDMVRCAQCGMVMPRSDALPGRGGHFCGEAHRAEFERHHPLG